MTYKIKMPKEKESKTNSYSVSREYKLTPQYDSKKSFYGKAKVRNENGKTILRSYDTDVAVIENGKPKVYGTYSSTTLKHIKEFLKQKGFKAETKEQILKDYGKEEKEETSNKQESSHLKTVYATAKMGDIMYQNQKERNDYKYRILKAGLGNRGLFFPDNWNELSENEKEKRLNLALEQIKDG